MEEKTEKIYSRLSLLDTSFSNTIVGVFDGSYSVRHISGTSGLNEAYKYIVDFVSDEKLRIEEIVDTDVKFTLIDENSKLRNSRSIYGKVYKIEESGIIGKKYLYKIDVVSPFQYLYFNNHYKIFQNKTAIDIITEIIGSTNHLLNLQVVNKLDGASLSKREICTQHNQSDAEFILMLAQEEKFSISFDSSSNDSYKMILVNIADHAEPLADPLLCTFNLSKSFKSTSFVANHYDFQNPSVDYGSKSGSSIASSSLPDNSISSQLRAGLEVENMRDRLELFNGGLANDINRYTKLNATQNYSGAEFITGNSISLYTNDSLLATLYEERRNKTISAIITNTTLEANFPNALDEFVDSGNPYLFSVDFKAIPEGVPYTTSTIITKPTISGVQTAIVAQGGDNTIDVDSLGRIRVIFHFDRQKPTTCYIRLGTMYSGNDWGAQFFPRVNTEVIVSFINGNIDKPIIIGAVYNGNNKIPYDPVANKTQSYIKTQTTPGGGGYNELLFEDKAAAELLSLRAQKDYKLHALHDSQINIDNDQVEVVGHDETINIGNDRTETVGHDETITIGNDRTETVVNNETISIGVDRTETVGSNETISIGVDRTETVGSNETISIGVDRTKTVGSNETISIGSNKIETIGSNLTTNVASNSSSSVGSSGSLSIGDNYAETIGKNKTETISIAKALSIGAGYQISVGGAKNETIGLSSTEQIGVLKHLIVGKRFELQVGASSLILNADGTIMLKGTKISIDGSTQVKANSKMIDLN